MWEGLECKPFIFVLEIWKTRNKNAFDDEVFSFKKLKNDFYLVSLVRD